MALFGFVLLFLLGVFLFLFFLAGGWGGGGEMEDRFLFVLEEVGWSV